MKTDPRRSAAALVALAAVCLLATGLTASVAVRAWTDDLNRTWQGEFLRMDGASAVFLVNGKEYPFPIAVPHMMKETIDTTKRLYQRVRAESHPGKHPAWDAHINLALEWFESLAQGAGH